jgi:hypothetical protein
MMTIIIPAAARSKGLLHKAAGHPIPSTLFLLIANGKSFIARLLPSS